MSKKQMLGWGVCGAMALACLSLFMDFAEFYGLVSMNAFDLMEASAEFDGGYGAIVAVIATFGGLALALIGNIKGTGFGLAKLCSIVSVIFMFLFFSDGMDYAASGFWIFMIAHVAAFVLSIKADGAME